MQIGDRVSVLDEDLEGVVKAIQGQQVTFTTEDEFDLIYPKHQLVVVKELGNPGFLM